MKLPDKVKQYIVQRLACYDSPAEVIALVKLHFNLEIKRQQIAYYQPEVSAGAELSPRLRDLYEATRKHYLDNVGAIPCANQAYRVGVIQKGIDNAVQNRNFAQAAEFVKQAAQEVGGAFTNESKVKSTGTMTFMAAPGDEDL